MHGTFDIRYHFLGRNRHCGRGAGVEVIGYNSDYARALRLRIAEEIAARAREEARALALEAELARVRADTAKLQAFYEEREAKLKARIGGELLCSEHHEREAAKWFEMFKVYTDAAPQNIRDWDAMQDKFRKLSAQENLLAEVAELNAEIARLRAVVAQLQAVPLSEEGADDAKHG